MMNSNEKKSFAAPFLGAALVTATTCSLAAAIFTSPGYAFADQWESCRDQIDAIDNGDAAKMLVASEDVSSENQNDAGNSGVDDIVWGENQGIPDWAESINVGGPEYDDGEYEITDDPFGDGEFSLDELGGDELGDDDLGGNDLGGDEFDDDKDAEIAEDQDAEDQGSQNDAGNTGIDDGCGSGNLGAPDWAEDIDAGGPEYDDGESDIDWDIPMPGEDDGASDKMNDDSQQEGDGESEGKIADEGQEQESKAEQEQQGQEGESKAEEERAADNSENVADTSDSNSSDQGATTTTETNTTYNYEYNYESTTETRYEYLYNNVEYKVVEVPHDGGMRDSVHQCTGYILPDSSSRIYSRSELECLSNWELYLARNEMYARHGRGFENSDLQDYFNSCSWYSYRYDPSYFDAHFSLSSTEMANAETMKDIEYSRNSPYVS